MRVFMIMFVILVSVGTGFSQLDVKPKIRAVYPDLVAGTPELQADRTVRFSVINKSSIPVEQPFTVQLYVNGTLTKTITLQSAPGYSSSRQNFPDVKHAQCTPLTLRVVVDPAQAVRESTRANNDVTNAMTSPCPDVTAKIEKNSTDNGLQFKTRVRIRNQGEMTMPAVQVRTVVASTKITEPAQPASACLTNMQLSCEKDSRTVGPLSPGQEKTFNVDPLVWAGVTRLHAQVDITCGPPGPMHTPECTESDYANNTVKKGID